jgi:hypothetical protein
MAFASVSVVQDTDALSSPTSDMTTFDISVADVPVAKQKKATKGIATSKSSWFPNRLDIVEF